MVQIILIRPGATEFDREQRIAGTLDMPLSDEGVAQVEQIARQLADRPLEAIITAPSESAMQTARAVAKSLDVKIKVVDKLRNVDHGLWQGKLIDEVKQTQPKVYRQWRDDPDCICPPEGEMLADARERVRDVIGKVLKKYKQGEIAIVAPEPLASLIHCQLVAGNLSDIRQTVARCGSWEQIDVPSPSLV